MKTMKPDEDLKQATESLAGHTGVVGVQPLPGRAAFEIEYDPGQLSEDQLRQIAEDHVPPPALALLRSGAVFNCAPWMGNGR